VSFMIFTESVRNIVDTTSYNEQRKRLAVYLVTVNSRVLVGFNLYATDRVM
jgi:hypothetical protein